ncbi:integrase DNA-binding domain-containing protein [[Clostridium] scindens]|uniref:integrase DNA-binding domain-containing protein n=1 Tax=Clostridium scindens (strain JCM 10418 / VPI 12708) TaxID=29347 RepID=UPI002ED60E32
MEIRERNGFVARKDNRGRNLRTGESQRKDGLYMYRYKDERTGRRLAVYSPDLAELRKKEKEIEKDQSEGILTDTQCKNMTLNDLFEIHMDTRKLAESTQANYRRMWNSLVRNELGQMKVVQVRPSHVRLFYSRLSKQKYSHSTIKFLHNMILPSFEVAVDDDIIRKNPAKRTLGDYGEPEKKRTALSFDQQKNLLNYVKNSEVFHIYLPLLQVMIGTGLRCGDDDDKIRLNQRKPSKYKGLSRFGPEKNLQRINKFMKERPTFYKKLIQMKENFRFYLRCFYCITKVVILQFNSEKQDRISS